MTASTSIIAGKKSVVLAIENLLQQQGYRTDCFVGKMAAAGFLKKRPETMDLLILDYDLAKADNFHFIEQISEAEQPAVPVLFIVKPDELPETRMPYLQPGRYDFIDSSLKYLIPRVSVLLEISKIQTKPDSKNKSKNSILAGLSHDLRNPIHGILSYAKIGVKKTVTDQLTREKSQHYYQSILDAGARLLDMLNDILELAKLDADRISFDICERNLGTVTRGVISSLFKEIDNNHLSVILNEPDRPVAGFFDAKQIGQVIRRLLSSCFQTAETAAEIILKIETIEPSPDDPSALDCPAIRFTLHHPEGSFSEERLHDLQDLFNQNPEIENRLGHLGLNFAICQRIVASHKGRIWINRHSDRGVVFGFALPKQ